MTNRPVDLVRLMRPRQWLKSLVVCSGLLFAHAWHDAGRVWQVGLAVLAMSLASSAVYAFNDLTDVAADRLHPQKANRPLASGAVSVPAARKIGLASLTVALGLAWLVSPGALIGVLVYLGLNVGYTCGWKHVAILDVCLIASGFLLRILIGTTAVGIPASHWLLLCGFLIALFLALTKRRAELVQVPAGRPILSAYPLPLLDSLITITAAVSLLSYALYTLDPLTARLQGTPNLIATVPCVVYGLFRYLFLLHTAGAGQDFVADLLQDRQLRLAIVVWLGCFVFLRLYAGP